MANVHFLSDSDVLKLKKLIRESRPVTSRLGGPRRTRIIGSRGGSGTTNVIEFGRVVKAVIQPDTIEDPENPLVQIPNPDLFRNKIPRWLLKAKDRPMLSWPLPAQEPTYPDFDLLVDFPLIGKPFIYGMVEVVLVEAISVPTVKELLGRDPDPNDPNDVPPDWFLQLNWPKIYQEQMQIDPDAVWPSPLPPEAPSGTNVGDPRPNFAFPREIDNPDWGGPGDPDSEGNSQFIPNEDKFATAWWENRGTDGVLTNSIVQAIDGIILFASPTTIKTEAPSPGGPGGAP